MKRILASVLVLSLFSIGFVGCSDKKADKKAAPATPAAPDKAADKK
jgi:hypothetical protein